METDTEKTSTAPFVDVLEKDFSKPEKINEPDLALESTAGMTILE